MNFWDTVDTIGLLFVVVWLTWFWFSVSRTILNPDYPKERHLGAYKHILIRGCLGGAPIIIILVVQQLVTGRS